MFRIILLKFKNIFKIKKMDVWKNQIYIKDLEMLLVLIGKYEIEGNFKALNDIVDTLRSKEFVDYEFTDLEFAINGGMKGTLPKDETFNYIIVKIDNKVAITYPLTKNIDNLHIYRLDLKIELYKSKFNKSDARFSSWHLDKEKNSQNCRYTHPYYHLQFGGKKLENIEKGLGILSAPRIPHPPMDVILAFHFIINNFYNNENFSFVKKLMQDPDYKRVLKNSQERIWEDYFKAYQLNNEHKDYSLEKVFPLYTS